MTIQRVFIVDANPPGMRRGGRDGLGDDVTDIMRRVDQQAAQVEATYKPYGSTSAASTAAQSTPDWMMPAIVGAAGIGGLLLFLKLRKK